MREFDCVYRPSVSNEIVVVQQWTSSGINGCLFFWVLLQDNNITSFFVHLIRLDVIRQEVQNLKLSSCLNGINKDLIIHKRTNIFFTVKSMIPNHHRYAARFDIRRRKRCTQKDEMNHPLQLICRNLSLEHRVTRLFLANPTRAIKNSQPKKQWRIFLL